METFDYFDGEIYVRADPALLLERFKSVTKEMVLLAEIRGGEDEWFHDSLEPLQRVFDLKGWTPTKENIRWLGTIVERFFDLYGEQLEAIFQEAKNGLSQVVEECQYRGEKDPEGYIFSRKRDKKRGGLRT